MKVLQANAGTLTNYEVLEFLRGRGATSDPMGCLGAAAPSECKIKESINEFLNKTEKFKLAKVEKLNIINLRPSNPAIIDTIIEYGEKCLAKDDVKGIDEVQGLVDLVLEVLPPPSPRSEDEMQGQEEMPTEKAMDED
ncbi:uncharacterized protein LOC122046008 [Zingiber officinale]|uniref:uncharacterized protein LOC122046008 n=1 Tax=Zingiber officinale TaxID=94328 RepID=UPI001C4ADB26|nr:uncharacterized protein LOC122046008 [Zingiber officinale]